MARGKGAGGGKGGRQSRGGGGSGGGSSGASANAIRAGAAFVELFTKDTLLERGLKAASGKLKSWASTVAKIGGGMLAASAASMAPLLKAMSNVTSRGNELTKLASIYGDTIENISRLQYAADVSGAGWEKVQGALENLPERIDEAARGGGEAAAAFQRLGVSAAQLKELNLTDRLAMLADGMAGISNATERAALASKLFSDVGLEGMLPLLGKGSAQFRAWLRDSDSVGRTVRGDDAKAGLGVWQSFFRVWSSIVGVFDATGNAMVDLASKAKPFVDPLVAFFSMVRETVNQNRAIVGTITAVAAGVAAAGAAFVGLGAVLKIASVGLSGLAFAFGALKLATALALSPMGLFVAAVGGGVALWARYSASGQSAMKAIGDHARTSFADIKDGWKEVTDAVARGDLELASKVTFGIVNLEWQKLCNSMERAWSNVLGTMREATLAWRHFLEMHLTATRNVIAGGLSAAGERLGLLPAGTTEQSAQASREELKALRQQAGTEAKNLAMAHGAELLELEKRLAEARAAYQKLLNTARNTNRANMEAQFMHPAQAAIGTAVRGGFQFGNASQFFGGSNSYMVQHGKRVEELLKGIQQAITTIPMARL